VPIPGLESVPRYAELVYRLLGEEVEFIPPGFVFEDDRPEYSFLKRELRWACQPVTAGPIAAQSSFVQAQNLSRNRIVVVTSYFALVAAAQTVQQLLTTTVRGATGGSFPIALDTRWDPSGGIAGRDSVTITFGTTATFPADIQIGAFTVPANTWTKLPFDPVILAPGGAGVLLNDPTLNQAFTAFMTGYSRAARPEEISP
jgi:hypothetical protein